MPTVVIGVDGAMEENSGAQAFLQEAELRLAGQGSPRYRDRPLRVAHIYLTLCSRDHDSDRFLPVAM